MQKRHPDAIAKLAFFGHFNYLVNARDTSSLHLTPYSVAMTARPTDTNFVCVPFLHLAYHSPMEY